MLWLLLSTEGPAGRGGRLSSPVSRRARLRRPWAEPEPLAHGAPPRSGPHPLHRGCVRRTHGHHMATEVTVRGLPQGPSVSAVQNAVCAEHARRG